MVIFVVAGRTDGAKPRCGTVADACLVVDADGIAPHVMHQGIVLATDLPDMIEGVVVTGLESRSVRSCKRSRRSASLSCQLKTVCFGHGTPTRDQRACSR